jgi:hypothetical protein
MKRQMHVAEDELARMMEGRGAYRGLVGKREGKRPHGKPRRG